MKKNRNRSKRYLFLAVLLVFSFLSSGCSKIDELKVKAGLKNTDFEYMNQGKIQKVVIQSTRDQGFRFIVTDKNVIEDLYNALSTAKVSSQKSSLEPDYVFEMDEGNNKVHKFNYIAGLEKKDSGNLYSDDKIYVVSKRIDNEIISKYWVIRRPKNFTEIYYGSISDALNQYLKDKDKDSKTVGINIKDDVESAKFILSTDLEDFKESLKSEFKNVSVVDKDKENYDVLVTIKTQGYKSTLFKAIVTFWDKNERSEKKYYIFNKYESGRWNVKVSEEKPKDF